ncbi:MAG: MFS transporter [Kiritimatiellae bacterium]|nr:MFS transporter [Kiritimatiellia bacterium]
MGCEIKGSRLLFLSFAAAMGGFLFGYDTAVINGGEQQIQSQWALGASMHGWVMSSALWGTVLGAVFGGRVADRLGRKPALFWVGVLYFASAVWSAFAQGPYSLMAARFIGGLGVGASSIAAPVYIAEISPPGRRGRLGGLFQLNIVIGMVVSQLVNWCLGGIGENAWRWMLGAEAVPALLFASLCPFLDESPRWLAQGCADRRSPAPFFVRGNLRPIMLVFMLAMFNQLSGINAMMYFAKRVFEMAGFSPQIAFGAAAALSAVLGVGTFAGLFLIDRLGRRRLLIVGSVGCIVAHFATALAFVCGVGLLAALCIFPFIIFFAMGQGVVIWVFISEIFPQKSRAQGQSFGSFVHWSFCAVLTFVFPVMAQTWPPWTIFAFFGACLVAHLVWAALVCPETKGKTLEEIG